MLQNSGEKKFWDRANKPFDLDDQKDLKWLIQASRRRQEQPALYIQAILQLVNHLSIFNGVGADQLRQIVLKARLQIIEAGQFVTKDNQKQKKWYGVVLSGRAQNYLASNDTLSNDQSYEQRQCISIQLLGRMNQQKGYINLGQDKVVYDPYKTITNCLILGVYKQVPLPLKTDEKKTGSLRLLKRVPILATNIRRIKVMRNRVLEGVYYVLKGEFQTTKRIIARGWITKGTARGQGQLLEFNNLIFCKSVLHIQQIWEQFKRDVQENGNWPSIQSQEQTKIQRRHSQNMRYKRDILPRIQLSFEKKKMLERIKHRNYKLQRLQQNRLVQQSLSYPKKKANDVDTWMLNLYVHRK